MSLLDILATVQRWRDRVQRQAQLARDIWHLREAAGMLFDDKPDKTKAVEAVNDIAAKRLAMMDAEARALFDEAVAMPGGGVACDPAERLRWLMCVNQPGRYPYTMGISASEGLAADADTGCARSVVLGSASSSGSADQRLAAALADGWSRLAAAQASDDDIDGHAMQLAIAFDEHRTAQTRALACAARRLWAVSLREHFGVSGDGLKLVLVQRADAGATAAADSDIAGRNIDRAEAALLAALGFDRSSAGHRLQPVRQVP